MGNKQIQNRLISIPGWFYINRFWCIEFQYPPVKMATVFKTWTKFLAKIDVLNLWEFKHNIADVIKSWCFFIVFYLLEIMTAADSPAE